MNEATPAQAIDISAPEAQQQPQAATPPPLPEPLPPALPETAPAQETQPAKPAATTADILGGPVPPPESETRPFRNKEWYRDNLDWSKSNSDLAKIADVSRQRIAQLRKELFPDGKIPPQPKAPEPDFSDIDPNRKPPEAEQPQQPQQPEGMKIDKQALSEMTFDVTTGLLCRMFGPEWQAADVKERETMIKAIKRYADSKEMPDLTPGWALVLMAAVYSAPRLGAQPTRNKLKLGWLWLKSKFSRKSKFTPKIV